MNRAALRFPTIVELIDFSMMMRTKPYDVNRMNLTLIAGFSKEDIDYATKCFGATVLYLFSMN
jgi:hypothetical protein